MTGEQFYELFATRLKLRKQIRDRACRRARGNYHDIEDYCSWAWATILEAPSNKTNEYYYEIAYKAIESAYWKNYVHWRAVREIVKEP